MRALGQLLSALFALAVLIALGLGFYYMFVWVVGYISGLDQQIEPSLIAVFFGFIVLASLVHWTRNRESEIRLLMEKAEVYRRFLTAWSRVLQCPDSDRARAEAELKTAEHELLLWANSGVLRAYTAIRELRETPHTQAERWAVEKVVRAMRMECKQQTVGLKRGDLLSLLLSGADSTATERVRVSPVATPKSVDSVRDTAPDRVTSDP